VAGVEEVDILWISEGMSCDGDSVSITAAGQPSIEDVLLGAIPGLPKVNLHNKVLSPTLGGEEFLTPFRAAVRARHRGLDPEREDQRRRLLDLVRQRRGDG
jgi:hydrogenase small subunit